MGKSSFLGEFEQMVLLAILQLGDDASALNTRRELEGRTDRSVSRGALYTTFERLEEKDYLEWSLDTGSEQRGGLPRRKYRVTEEGLAALRTSRHALFRLWDGLEHLLGVEG